MEVLEVAKSLLLNHMCESCSGRRVVGAWGNGEIHYKCMYQCKDQDKDSEFKTWAWRELPIEMTCEDWRE